MKLLKFGAYLFGLIGAGYIGYKLGCVKHEQCACSANHLCDGDMRDIDILHVEESPLGAEENENTKNSDWAASYQYWKESYRECNEATVPSDVSQPKMERESILDESGSPKSMVNKNDVPVTTTDEPAHVICDKSLDTFSDGDNTVLEIESIKPKEFVQAVASGSLMRSFVFNPQTKEFYWNFTEEDVDHKDAVDWFGQSIIDEILEESSFNANGWIQPRFLYNKTEDVYIKIETGTIII